MKTMKALRLTTQSVIATLLAAVLTTSALAASKSEDAPPVRVATVNETQTSWIPRVITNVIEVRIPTNIFINVYRTNLIEAVRSNIINVYRTNWTDRTETVVVPVDLTRTNYITRYETNVQTLTFTNWETVLVMKTNRVTQRVPNVVQIDMPANRAGAAAAATPEKPGATPEAGADGVVLDTVVIGKLTVDELVEVQFKLKSASGAMPKLASYEWRVERTDGRVLLFGKDPEFKRELPLGTYNIEVKTRSTARSPFERLRSVVEVTDTEVIQQQPVLRVSAR